MKQFIFKTSIIMRQNNNIVELHATIMLNKRQGILFKNSGDTLIIKSTHTLNNNQLNI